MNREFIVGLSFLSALPISAGAATDIEEVQVFGVQNLDTRQIETEVLAPADSAQMLQSKAGADVNSNGALTGIPQYRGMYGARLQVMVDGARITPGGPNLMDPPLHYAPSLMLDELLVYRGIAPVRVAQEAIGGVIEANTWQGEFGATDQFGVSGRLAAAAQSVNGGTAGFVAGVLSNQQHKLRLGTLLEQGDDTETPAGDIVPSEYERDRYDVGYSWRDQGHQLDVALARNETGYAGTPALSMDIYNVDTDLGKIGYRWQRDERQLQAKVYWQNVEHTMTNYHLRQAPMPDMFRRNDVTSDSVGFQLQGQLERGMNIWRLGLDGHYSEHSSDISNPNNGMFFIDNFNEAQRDTTGIWAELEQRYLSALKAHYGLRYNQVQTDAGEINAAPAVSGMAAAVMLRDRFNNAERQQTDHNIDWVAKLSYELDSQWLLHAGVARKTRSPDYIERYVWLPLPVTGGLADGNNYVGNLDLEAEVAHEIELGVDWSGTDSFVSPRIFYRDVQDYIQGVAATDEMTVMFSTMMTGDDTPLMFANIDARLYGVDLEWQAGLTERWALSGIATYVRGERRDISDDLYRVQAPQIALTLHYEAKRWRARLENRVIGRQEHSSIANGESESSGYALTSASVQAALMTDLSLVVGVDNLFDRQYQPHLGGVNRAAGGELLVGDKLYGAGRNLYARLNWEF